MASRTGYVGTETIGQTVDKANFDKSPGGMIGNLTISGNSGASGTGTSSVPGLSPLTFNAVAGRRYRIVIGCSSITTSGTTGSCSIAIWDLTTGPTQLAGHVLSIDGNGAGNWSGGTVTVFHEPGAGSQSYGFRIVNTLTTSTIINASATAPAQIMLFDEGPTF